MLDEHGMLFFNKVIHIQNNIAVRHVAAGFAAEFNHVIKFPQVHFIKSAFLESKGDKITCFYTNITANYTIGITEAADRFIKWVGELGVNQLKRRFISVVNGYRL